MLNEQQQEYLREFLLGYMVCALWSSTDNSDDSGGDPMDQNYNVDDIDEETQRSMAADCAEFVKRHWADLQIFKENGRPADHAGHDFWLNRNGHGAGFWDRFNDGEPEAAGKRLSEACGWQTDFPEINLYIGDDGKVHVDSYSQFV